MSIHQTYWQNYYDESTVARSNALRQEVTIQSTGVNIQMDVYEQPDKSALVVILNHGAGGYSRIFLPVTLALYERGYTVIAPNQRGQGYSEGDRGDFTVGQFVQNIVDVTHWARQRYSGVLFLLGGSVGSGLVYNAAAESAPVDAIICHNLYDFGSVHDTIDLSRFAALRHLPGCSALTRTAIQFFAALMPGLRLPFGAVAKFDAMVDDRDTRFYDIWKNDPLPIKSVSLRYMRSTFSTPARIPFEANTRPILVINPVRDKMVSPVVTKRNFDRLGGPKQYVEIDYGHWATGESFVNEYISIIVTYLQQHIST
ncbi:MAG: alpha/beta fold hydrolase [Anaerolineae bacterium]|nr:alpha/beta fold hydrolase [Anaerolineae bacterium]